MKLLLLCLCSVAVSLVAGQRITTIQLDGVQYFVSRMNPYSPELNYFLAYQYCRSLGLQLASFETKEKVESMSQYLQNAGYSKYDFWTSGNRLGTGMFLWMSTGLPFNATFDYFENSKDAVSLLDPIDHNSNTSPQRTARDSSSGLEKGCVILRAPGLRWAPEDCSEVKDFICEQTRCYYYNYGSIPVSSAQGRPIIITTTTSSPPISTTTETPDEIAQSSTTTRQYLPTTSSTPLPLILSSLASSSGIHRTITATFATSIHRHETDKDENNSGSNDSETATTDGISEGRNNDDDVDTATTGTSSLIQTNNDNQKEENPSPYGALKLLSDSTSTEKHLTIDGSATEHNDIPAAEILTESSINNIDNTDEHTEHEEFDETKMFIEDTTSVEQRLKKISEEIEKYSTSDSDSAADLGGRQSFFSLSDLIKTLRPSDKKVVPQIDGDYSNTMRVLGDQSSIVSGEESRRLGDLKQSNRALF